MAIYRQIHIDFWQDELVAEFSPEDKYFYLYLMTNNKTTQCGVYRINLRVMSFDLGWDKTTVEKLIARFVDYGRIKYNAEHGEIFMVNWLKYNKATSPKVAALIDKQIAEIKTDEFKRDVISLCIQYRYPIQSISQPEPEPEPKEKPEPSESDPVAVVLKFYQQNIAAMMSPFEIEKLADDVSEFGADLLLYAMEIALTSNKRSYRYVEGILKRWRTEGVKHIDQVRHNNEEQSASVEETPEDSELEARREAKRRERGLV